MSIFAPLIYMAIGFGIGRLPYEVKGRAAHVLTHFVIPVVIVYNIATHRPGIFAILVGTIAMMSTMLALSRLFTRDPIANLCFCYLNTGWFGLPIASSLFGPAAAMLIISVYVGNSLFGNSISAALLAEGEDLRQRVWRMLKSPPLRAMALGLLLIPWGAQVEAYGQPLYEAMRFLMSFLGMAILGIWLATTPLQAADLRRAVAPFLARVLLSGTLVTLLIRLCEALPLPLVSDNQAAMYLICLLPPAPNIVALETQYLKTGRSAPMVAAGTCLSIVAVALYGAAVLFLRNA